MAHPRPWLLFAALAVPFGCSSSASTPRDKAEQAPVVLPSEEGHPASEEKVVRLYGKTLGEAESISLDALLAAPDTYAGKNVIVRGVVQRACTRKGCWAELATSRAEGAKRCRVTFKDYSFFVPTDSAGSSARLEGVVEVATVEPAMVAHLEEEGARFASKSETGEAREVRIVASGIELWR